MDVLAGRRDSSDGRHTEIREAVNAIQGFDEKRVDKTLFFRDNSVTTRYNLLREAEDYIMKTSAGEAGSSR